MLGDALCDGLVEGEVDDEGEGEREIDGDGLVLLDGLTDELALGLKLTLPDGLAELLGERDTDWEADGLSDDRPVPSGVSSSSLNLHATWTTLSVCHASSS